MSSVPNLENESKSSNLNWTAVNSENTAIVRITTNSRYYYLIHDVEKMTLVDVFSSLGGSLNLWSGITAIVIVEIIDAICRIIRNRHLPAEGCAQTRNEKS